LRDPAAPILPFSWRQTSNTLPSSFELSTCIRNQSAVSDIGLALASGAQMLGVAAIAISFSQHFWRNLWSCGHTISQIDAREGASKSIRPLVISRCAGAIQRVALALLATAMSAVSILHLQVSFNRNLPRECSVKSLRNLPSMITDHSSKYSTAGRCSPQEYLSHLRILANQATGFSAGMT